MKALSLKPVTLWNKGQIPEGVTRKLALETGCRVWGVGCGENHHTVSKR